MDFWEELPEQIIRDILLRVPYKSQPKVKQFLKPVKETMECFKFYRDRIDFGTSQKYICVLQAAGISIYDPVDQSWELVAPLPTEFEVGLFSQILCVNHKLVLLDVKHYGNLTPKILIYDLLTSTWKQGAEIPTTRSVSPFACCASYEGLIYVAGGFGQDGDADGNREAAVYRVNEDKWELLPKMQEEVGMCKGVFIEGMFYVIGIFDNTSERFDPKTGEWTRIMDTSLNDINIWDADLLYAFGQLIAFGSEGIAQYDWEQNVWTELEAPPKYLSFARATLWGDRIFLCNCNNLSFLDRPLFYMYKPGAVFSERWISFNKPRNFLEMPIVSIATVEI